MAEKKYTTLAFVPLRVCVSLRKNIVFLFFVFFFI